MSPHPVQRRAALLDSGLGDPGNGGRLFSYARCGALDEREEFPVEICRELDLLGLPRAYVPVAYGGELQRYDETLQLMRAVARRDLTVAIAHGKTFLGAVSAWVGGTPEQARALGARIADGAVVSWGLTEREHGSDLLAGEVTAAAHGDGYRVSGEKWLINNANRGELVCLLARTDADASAGARGFSLLLVDKQALPRESWRPLPGVKLHGIRGADIGGLSFSDAPVPGSALVGTEGAGTEIVLKSLQLTRTLCASLSLGAADNALDLAVGFARHRQAYGHRLLDLPQTRRLLARSYADVLLCEALTLVSARSIHALTGELSVVSAVAKYLVPTVVDEVLARLGTVLGARSLLAGDTWEHGRFQKVQRDHRIVGTFDGNTLVNLHALVNHFPLLVRRSHKGTVDAAGLAAATVLDAPLPEFDREGLSLLPRAGSSLTQSLAGAVTEITAEAARGGVPASLAAAAQQLLAEADAVLDAMADHRPTAVAVPARAFTTAERYAAVHAGSAALHLWLRNRHALDDGDGLWSGGLWLEAALTRVLARLRPGLPAHDEVLDRLVPHLTAQHAGGRLPSLLPYSLVKDSA
ncbi:MULTISPECIES: acyl-CoA dehydrogenase family protein [unclassified Streptomyces]|uniref:acyl-CoA dehydrogenase family protein n=1 Tax=unclassified Streptomyces TaxID=2593676 RepID=UPI002E2C585D|nr:acyl-CoA dehydrogenase family protein [Streptomyces sp. NBC_00273]